ncbi:MAG TPA: hypothetical protein VF658_13300 [Pyrinomonadaceae bacterium]|jgi:hypothetical protein
MAIISNKDAAIAHATQSNAGAGLWQPEKVTPFLRERAERSPALKRVLPARDTEQEAAALPMLATASDVREVVRLLKKRASGVTIIEGMDAIKRIFDPRKVAAYEYWGLVTRTNDRLRLSALGWEFARKLELEARLYRTMLDRTLAYRSALEWVFGQNLEIVTDADIAAYWLEHPAEVFLTGNRKMIEAAVACFFHLCQEAELGMATVGKRGQPTRLRVEREDLAAYIAANSSLLPDDAPSQTALEVNASQQSAPTIHEQLSPHKATESLEKMRVLVSRRKDASLIKQIQMMLEVAGVESETSQRVSGGAEFMPDELFELMRRCDAAVIVVTTEDCRIDDAGEVVLDEGLMMEIAAANVHYNRRVILLWDESVALPPRLRDLRRCEFAGDQLTWDSGMQLLKALKKFES